MPLKKPRFLLSQNDDPLIDLLGLRNLDSKLPITRPWRRPKYVRKTMEFNTHCSTFYLIWRTLPENRIFGDRIRRRGRGFNREIDNPVGRKFPIQTFLQHFENAISLFLALRPICFEFLDDTVYAFAFNCGLEALIIR